MNRRLRRAAAILLFGPTLAWNMLLGRWLKIWRWWDQVEPHVWIGALPLRRDVPAMNEMGVRAVVNTCAEWRGPESEYRKHGIEQLHIPTIDYTPPALADVVRAVDFIEHHRLAGQGVYIHCKAGRSRSATVVVCWLIAAKGLTPEQAQALLLEKRPHVNPHVADRAVVREFCRRGS